MSGPASRWTLVILLFGSMCCGSAQAQAFSYSDSTMTPSESPLLDTMPGPPAPPDSTLLPTETSADSALTAPDSIPAPVSGDTSREEPQPEPEADVFIYADDSLLKAGSSEMDVTLGFFAPYSFVGGGFTDGESTSEVGPFTYRNPSIHDAWAVGASIGLRRHAIGESRGHLDQWAVDLFYLASHGHYTWQDTVSELSMYTLGLDIMGESARLIGRFAPLGGIGGHLSHISTEGGATDGAGNKMTGQYNRLAIHVLLGVNTYIYDHLWLSARGVWRPSGLQFLSVDDELVDLSGEEDILWLDAWFGMYWAFTVK